MKLKTLNKYFRFTGFVVYIGVPNDRLCVNWIPGEIQIGLKFEGFKDLWLEFKELFI